MTYPEIPGAKTSGTSQMAADDMRRHSTPLQEACLQALSAQPMTADECAMALGKSILAIRPRFSELRRLGKITDTGKRRCNVSGKAANVWNLCQ